MLVFGHHSVLPHGLLRPLWDWDWADPRETSFPCCLVRSIVEGVCVWGWRNVGISTIILLVSGERNSSFRVDVYSLFNLLILRVFRQDDPLNRCEMECTDPTFCQLLKGDLTRLLFGPLCLCSPVGKKMKGPVSRRPGGRSRLRSQFLVLSSSLRSWAPWTVYRLLVQSPCVDLYVCYCESFLPPLFPTFEGPSVPQEVPMKPDRVSVSPQYFV